MRSERYHERYMCVMSLRRLGAKRCTHLPSSIPPSLVFQLHHIALSAADQNSATVSDFEHCDLCIIKYVYSDPRSARRNGRKNI